MIDDSRRLVLRVVKTPVVPGGVAFLLHDSMGNPLPNQMVVSVEHGGVDECPTITVKFMVDGQGVRIEKSE